MSTVRFQEFRGYLATWDSIMRKAAAFASTLAPTQLISISQSEDANDGIATVWYWETPPEGDRPAGDASSRRRSDAEPEERAVAILPADDLAITRAFYVDALGFVVTFESTDDGRVGLMGLRRGGLELTIDAPMDGHGRAACVSLYVPDADALHAEWTRRVEMLPPVREEPWGARTFGVEDPAGNTLFVIGPPDAAPRRLLG